MVDWFRVFIGTATAVNTVANVSTSADVHSSVQMQKDAATIAMLRNLAKDIVFSTRRTAEKLTPIVQERPFLGYVVAKLLEIRIQQIGITSDFFPDYDEKTYLADTKDLVKGLRQSAGQLLSKEQIADAERAVKIVLTDGLLEAYIAHLSVKKALGEVEREIKELTNERLEIIEKEKKEKVGSQRRLGGILLVIGILLTCIIPVFGQIFGAFLTVISEDLGAITVLLSLGLPVIGFIIIVVSLFFVFTKSPERKEIESQISETKRKYQNIKNDLAKDEEVSEFLGQFGDLSYDEAVQLNQDNDEFIARVVSEEEFEQYFRISTD